MAKKLSTRPRKFVTSRRATGHEPAPQGPLLPGPKDQRSNFRGRVLSHIGPGGEARMVDVGEKPATHRVAVAEAEIAMKASTLSMIRTGKNPKGSVLEVARIAGINAAKHTSSLIPLCHPLALTKVGIEFKVASKTRLRITSQAEAIDRTGVEMEALTGAAVCALTVYDMCKAIDRGMEICRIRLLEKSGGKSGHYMRIERRKR